MTNGSNSKRLSAVPKPRVEFTPDWAKLLTIVSGATTVVHLLLRQLDVVQPHGFSPQENAV